MGLSCDVEMSAAVPESNVEELLATRLREPGLPRGRDSWTCDAEVVPEGRQGLQQVVRGTLRGHPKKDTDIDDALEFGRHEPRKLPRVARALQGWRRRCPSESRKPLSWAG